MAGAVAPEMASPAQVAACKWLTEDELRVYSGEFQRLDSRADCSGIAAAPIRRRRVNCSSSRGERSTCRRHSSGAAATGACTRSRATRACRAAPGRSWWAATSSKARAIGVQQEQADTVSGLLTDFLGRHAPLQAWGRRSGAESPSVRNPHWT